MNQLRRSYSQGELVGDDGDMNRNVKALPPHYPSHDHYASDYSLDHHNLPPGTSVTPKQHTASTLPTPPSPTITTPLYHHQQQQQSHHPLVTLPHHVTHTPDSLQLVPHTPETLLLSQQHMSMSSGPQQLHLHSQGALHSLQATRELPQPAVIASHSPPGSLQSCEDDPYSPIRYTLSLGTPSSPPQSPVTPQHLISPQHLTAAQQLLAASPQPLTGLPQQFTPPDAEYSPPLTRHRAKQQHTSMD